MPEITTDAGPSSEEVERRIAEVIAAAGDELAVARPLPEGLRRALPDTVRARSPDELEADGTPSTALLVLDVAGVRAASELSLDRRLGAACRRFPGRLLVWDLAREGEVTPAERFFAFGFRRVLDLVADGVRHRLFEYRLRDYKQPPDWLNARFWANPERFGEDPDELADPGARAGPDDASNV